MRRFVGLSLVAGAVVALVCASASAELAAGAKAPEITATDWLNSGPLALGKLRGKIVVVEFWATWCPPCRKSIPHLVELYKTYGPKGVVFMGLTDEPKTKVEPFAKEIGMVYPVGCGSPSGVVYGVQGIPSAFLVDTAGTVVWAGHPMAEDFEPAIKAQLEKTPPSARMSDKDKQALAALLDKAEAAVAKEDYPAAAGLMAKVKGEGEDAALKARAAKVRAELATRAEARLKEAETHAAAKKYYEASVSLTAAAALAPGSPAAGQALARLKELLADKDVLAAVQQGKREHEAAALLAEVEKTAAKKQPAALLEAYDDVATRFPKTEAGAAAADKAKTLRADPAAMRTIHNAAAEKDCKGWLSMARNFVKAGLNDKARPYLRRIIDTYPESDFARQAKEMLDAMAP